MDVEDVTRHLVTLPVAAEILGVSARTVQDLVRRGFLPFRQFPNARRMVELEDIRRILMNQHEGHPPIEWRERRTGRQG